MNKTVFLIVIPLVLLVYLSTIMAPYAGVRDISCAIAETTGTCRCAEKAHTRLVCYCQNMNHTGNADPGVIDSVRLAQSSSKPAVLARHCSCNDGKTTALPGLEKFEHLRSRLNHDVMRDEAYFCAPCYSLLHSRAEEPPEPPPP